MVVIPEGSINGGRLGTKMGSCRRRPVCQMFRSPMRATYARRLAGLRKIHRESRRFGRHETCALQTVVISASQFSQRRLLTICYGPSTQFEVQLAGFVLCVVEVCAQEDRAKERHREAVRERSLEEE